MSHKGVENLGVNNMAHSILKRGNVKDLVAGERCFYKEKLNIIEGSRNAQWTLRLYS